MASSADPARRFEEDGFAVLPGFVSPAACDLLRAHVGDLLRAFDPSGIATVFSTDDQRHAQDRWFLDSGDKIRFFFEPDAFDEAGGLRQAKELSINKIGHAMHDLDPVFDRFSRTAELADLAAAIGFTAPLLLQSMYIFKQPRIGGEVGCHQDSTFLHTEPLSCTGFWLALEEATIENGCLWAEPGGHRQPLRSRFVRDGHATRMATLDPSPLPTGGLVPIEAAKGTLVLLHGQLPHRSGPNRSDRSRHAYTLHLIEGAARYSPDNWLQRPDDLPLRGFQ
jgi:phytanoyl-CoA hydroxylase